MNHKFLSIFFSITIIAGSLFARTATDSAAHGPMLRKFYWGSGLDAGIFSVASIKRTSLFGNTTTSTGTLRFSYVINIGAMFNYNINEHYGLYTGVDLKNVGYIEKISGVTHKARTYNLGVPLGFKFGNMLPRRTYGVIGGGLDLPLNYKDKSFTSRNHKTKMNEWFSDRTPHVMPYVFAGAGLPHGVTLKLQYYPGNFVNTGFTQNGSKPYDGTEIHLVLFSIGYAIPFADRHDMIRKSMDDLPATKK